jgi:hypothetical protein
MPEDDDVAVNVEGIPGPSGGGRSFRVIRVGSASSSSDPGTLADNFDLLRGVEVLGGNAKFVGFAVCRSSPLFSATSTLLCAARSREGDGDGDEDDGGLGVLLRPGTCNVGGRKRSASDEDDDSSSNRPRREEGSLAGARGRTVEGEAISSVDVSINESSTEGASMKDRPLTVSNSQGLSSLTPKSCIL